MHRHLPSGLLIQYLTLATLLLVAGGGTIKAGRRPDTSLVPLEFAVATTPPGQTRRRVGAVAFIYRASART